MNKNETLSEITWVVGKNEKFNKWRKAILIFSLPFWVASYDIFLSNNNSLSRVQTYSADQLIQIFMDGTILYIFILIILLLIFRFIFKNQKYILSNESFQKTNGNVTRRYLWSEFNCFWPMYSGITKIEVDTQKIAKDIGNITGDSIYLLKKTNKLKKVIVTIDTLPENTIQVINLISQKLPRNIEAIPKAGLVEYK